MENNTYPNLTMERLEKTIKEILLDTPKVDDKEIVIGQGCLTNGYVTRSYLDLNVCNNPDCKSCREWDNAMKEEFKNYGK
jgi:hypothetical protein